MRYLIQSQAVSLGVEVFPAEETPKEKKANFDFSSLCIKVSPEVSKEIEDELEKMRNEWERDIMA